MDNHPREVLKELVRRYGVSLIADPLRTEGLLRDICGTHHREIFVLVNAMRQKVPADLMRPRHALPPDLLQDFLARRLCDELSLSDEASRWAVMSWAYALDLLPGIPREPEERSLPDKEPDNKGPSDLSAESIRQELAHALESPSLATRLRAVRDLAGMTDTGSVRLLVSALENGNWQVREGAFDALSGLGTAALPALREALVDTNDEIVWRACLLLGALQEPEAVQPLVRLLDREGIIRECAIWALGEIGDESVSTALLPWLNTSDTSVAYEAETALVKIGMKRPGNRS